MSKPIITIKAEYSDQGNVVATAYDEGSNVIDSATHSSEGWLIDDWGLHDYTVGQDEDGFTKTYKGANTFQHDRIRKIIGQPFVLRYKDIEVEVK